MANILYDNFLEQVLQGNVDLLTVNIKAVLVDLADYTPNASTHGNLADIPAAARVATSGNLTGKTVTNGTFDSDPPVLPSVTGDQSEAVVLYVDTGVGATSTLIGLWDTASAGLPVTPDGNNINVNPNAAGWFSL